MNKTGAPYGEAHGMARLTDAQVREMRKDYRPYVRGYGWLARKYRCGESTARDIVRYYTRWDIAC